MGMLPSDNKMLADYTASCVLSWKSIKGCQASIRHAGGRRGGKIEHEINKQLSIEQINIKREYSQKQEELKTMLISELRNRLALFMDSADYQRFLESEVKKRWNLPRTLQ